VRDHCLPKENPKMKTKTMTKKRKKEKNLVNNTLQTAPSIISRTYLLCTIHIDASLTTKSETNSRKSTCSTRLVDINTTSIFFTGLISRQCHPMKNHLIAHRRSRSSSLPGKLLLRSAQHLLNLGINLC
jgi:hypothetical protein